MRQVSASMVQGLVLAAGPVYATFGAVQTLA
jgi:hypothetical protein